SECEPAGNHRPTTPPPDLAHHIALHESRGPPHPRGWRNPRLPSRYAREAWRREVGYRTDTIAARVTAPRPSERTRALTPRRAARAGTGRRRAGMRRPGRALRATPRCAARSPARGRAPWAPPRGCWGGAGKARRRGRARPPARPVRRRPRRSA